MSVSDHLLRRPLEEAVALHADFYRDPAWLQVEKRRVMAQTWQLAAHAGDLRHSGDHVVCDIADKPILIVRAADGRLNAFYNVCRHRAGPIATCNGHGAKRLQCAYHSWTYDLDGNLRNAPEMSGAKDFDVSAIHLEKVQVQEWQGLVFVALSSSAPDFDSVFSGIAERVSPIDIAAVKFTRRDSFNIACNWKVYVDNYLEGYHLPAVHPGLSRVLDYRVYYTELFPWYSLQHSPLRNNDGIYGDGDAYYYFIYPNIMLNIMPGRLQTNRVLPLGHDRCIVEFDYYYADTAEARVRIDADRTFSDEIQDEDITICDLVQKGLMSGSYQAGRLCPKRESGVWHFQNLLRTAYADAQKDNQ